MERVSSIAIAHSWSVCGQEMGAFGGGKAWRGWPQCFGAEGQVSAMMPALTHHSRHGQERQRQQRSGQDERTRGICSSMLRAMLQLKLGLQDRVVKNQGVRPRPAWPCPGGRSLPPSHRYCNVLCWGSIARGTSTLRDSAHTGTWYTSRFRLCVGQPGTKNQICATEAGGWATTSTPGRAHKAEIYKHDQCILCGWMSTAKNVLPR